MIEFNDLGDLDLGTLGDDFNCQDENSFFGGYVENNGDTPMSALQETVKDLTKRMKCVEKILAEVQLLRNEVDMLKKRQLGGPLPASSPSPPFSKPVKRKRGLMKSPPSETNKKDKTESRQLTLNFRVVR